MLKGWHDATPASWYLGILKTERLSKASITALEAWNGNGRLQARQKKLYLCLCIILAIEVKWMNWKDNITNADLFIRIVTQYFLIASTGTGYRRIRA